MRRGLEQGALSAFYKRMNDTAKALNLGKTTHFHVAHGMHHDYNYSSALDVATISWNAMR
jgi:D-alanyl-D-alanine carboxypeptidase